MSHLTLPQRYGISILKEQKPSMSAIADKVGTSIDHLQGAQKEFRWAQRRVQG
ncbi:hypothetical protein MNBD_BACTEROID03-2254 [hydrothermal vent metagenome]|uniref:Uncharacterized protein n=1 Tax=hydrothermal vent metagenome TaxID=652676 RepID=A0A3B0T1Q5_9ZZZZ